MTDFMLTGIGSGPRDIQVNNCRNIREAIEIAERLTRMPIDHGRGGIGSKFKPNIIIDAETGEMERVHDRPALTSMEVVNHAKARGVTVARGA